MTMRQTADDPKAAVLGRQGIPGQSAPDDFDQVVGQIGEIPDGNVLDFPVLPERTSKQMGDVGLPILMLLDRGYNGKKELSQDLA